MKYYGRYKKDKSIWTEWEVFSSLDDARTTCELLAKGGAISGDKQIEICTEAEYLNKLKSQDEGENKE